MSICEGCKLERYLGKDGKPFCIDKTAFSNKKAERIAEGGSCDNEEGFKPLTASDKADAAYHPLG